MTGAAPRSHNIWPLVLAASAIILVTMATRQSLGLFMAPINESTQMGIVAISFAMAVGQLVWGAVQPVFGMIADRHGPGRVLFFGTLLLAAGSVLTTFAKNEFALVLTIGVFTAAGAGAGSFSVLISPVAQRTPPERRSFASGFVNAAASAGQSIGPPISQFFIGAFGWASAMYAFAIAALATLPCVRVLTRPAPVVGASATPMAMDALSLRQQLRVASRDRSYWCLHAGFFTCGFHIAFLVTHLPGEVKLCALPITVASTSLFIIGLANIAGSIGAGWMGGFARMKYILFFLYATRAVAIALFMAAPKTPTTFYLFAAVLGASWLATVPPTAGIIGKLFGVRYLATLFGLVTFTHQVGGFLGAWLGGIALVSLGDYAWMWYADMALALLAAFVNLPIREARTQAPAVATA